MSCVVGILGAPLTGKGVFAHEWIVQGTAPLRLAFSPVEHSDNYAALLGCARYTAIPALVDAIKAGARAAVFVPSLDPAKIAKQFDHFCRIVSAVGGARVLVEELSRVTSPSYAPHAWKNISTAGSHDSVELAATAQRPAQVDKDFLGGCTEIRCYRLKRRADAQAAASEMPGGAEPVTVDELTVLPDLHFVHWTRPGSIGRGVQPLPGKKKSRKKQG